MRHLHCAITFISALGTACGCAPVGGTSEFPPTSPATSPKTERVAHEVPKQSAELPDRKRRNSASMSDAPPPRRQAAPPGSATKTLPDDSDKGVKPQPGTRRPKAREATTRTDHNHGVGPHPGKLPPAPAATSSADRADGTKARRGKPVPASSGETAVLDAEDVEILKRLTGSKYAKRRDALLRSGGLATHLDQTPPPAGWQDAVARDILRGWLEHGALYRRVLGKLHAVDVKHESRKITGIAGVWEAFAARAAREYKADILPLCWEVILKHSRAWPTWKVIAFLRATAAVPRAESRAPVRWLLQHTANKQLQAVAQQTLDKLP